MNRRLAITLGAGCALLVLLLVIAIPVVLLLPVQIGQSAVERDRSVEGAATPRPEMVATQQAVPTLTPSAVEARASEDSQAEGLEDAPSPQPATLVQLYNQMNPGVVNIQVFVEQQGLAGQGAGSGFILDDQGHIVTNNHVIAQAQEVTVLFFNGREARAEIIGADADSDLAVIRVDELPEDVHPIPLGDSDAVSIGQWVVAIGNPFGLGSSMSTGIVSALGRVIPTGITPFSIPQAIQTDAAVNPGNSGGPLINLQGEVIGVNAQIATGGAAASAGVGFAIPSNIVRRVVPVLIQSGRYQWPWLGVEGGSVNLAIMEANDLPTQQGAYIHQVVPDSPADQAGLQGSTGTTQVKGLEVPVGGDVVIEANGESIISFADLLAQTAFSEVGETMQLVILRDGERQELSVELEARPSGFNQ